MSDEARVGGAAQKRAGDGRRTGRREHDVVVVFAYLVDIFVGECLRARAAGPPPRRPGRVPGSPCDRPVALTMIRLPALEGRTALSDRSLSRQEGYPI